MSGRALTGLLLSLIVTVAVDACGAGARSTPTASPTASQVQATPPATLVAPGGCTDASPCTLKAGTYRLSGNSVLPGMTFTLSASGWRSTEQDSGEFNLFPPDRPADRLFFWEDMVAVKSTGVGHGTTVLSNVGTTPAALTAWLISNPDFLVVSRPAPATIGAGIETTSLAVGVSPAARYGDAGCPSNPRCADFFTRPGLWGGDFYGIGGTGEVRLYLATITSSGQASNFLVAVDATSHADLAAFAAEATPIINSVGLPPGVVAG